MNAGEHPALAVQQEELRARGIRYCVGAYVDIHGNPKAKCVPIDHFQHMMQGSELYTGYALDGLGQPGGRAVLLEAQLGVGVDPHRHVPQSGREIVNVAGNPASIDGHEGSSSGVRSC